MRDESTKMMEGAYAAWIGESLMSQSLTVESRDKSIPFLDDVLKDLLD